MAVEMQFRDGTVLEYAHGSFDEWCVYYTNEKGVRKPPLDTEYFERMKYWYEKYGQIIYDDYVEVYEKTGKQVEEEVFDDIVDSSEKYDEEDSLDIAKVLSILYMAMIAEENKRYTKLGKRIKRLGMYKLLFEGYTPHDAAWFMKGMNWRDIDQQCKERGF